MAIKHDRFKKLTKLKGLKRLDGLERMSNPLGKDGRSRLPSLPELGSKPDEPNKTLIEELADEVGSYSLAKKLAVLQGLLPNATIPELIAMEFLDRRGYEYQYQVPVGGGRARAGGIVLDFLVSSGAGRAMGWRIQGKVIHSLRGRGELDAIQAASLRGSYVQGTKLEDLVDLYDTKLLDPGTREGTLEKATTGISVGS